MPGRQSETQLVELGMFISATLVGTVILAALAIIFGVKAIENRLETQAAALINSQIAVAAEEDPTIATRTDISVDASATTLRLRGTVGVEEHLATIPILVEQTVEGVSGVEANLEFLAPIKIDIPDVEASPISVTWQPGGVSIAGEVSEPGIRNLIISTSEGAFGSTVDAEALTVNEDVPSERDWISSFVGMIKIGGSTLPEGRLLVNPAERLIQMSGQYETRQQRRDAEADVLALVDATTFAFVNGLSIPEPPAFTQQEVEELQESIDDLIEGKVVEFELNSDVLTPVGIALLDEILAALEQFPNVPIEIAGHTDSQGDETANLDLSERRAQTALEYLVGKGQDRERFVVVGYGEEFPVASNTTEDGRARNRRIEFKALGE